MIKPHFIQRGSGGVRGNVAANIVLDAVGAHDHGQGVPTNEALDATLELLVAGEKRLQPDRNGVGVRSVGGEREVDPLNGGVRAKALENFGGDFGAARFQDGIQRFEPFLDFYVVQAVVLG